MDNFADPEKSLLKVYSCIIVQLVKKAIINRNAIDFIFMSILDMMIFNQR